MSDVPAEVLTQMTESDSVTTRDLGVIAGFLQQRVLNIADGLHDDPIQLAKALVAAQRDAGLATFILADLNGFIADVKAGNL